MKRGLTAFAAALAIAGSVTAGSALADTKQPPKPGKSAKAQQVYLVVTLDTVYVSQ
jgi:hypothetical protein